MIDIERFEQFSRILLQINREVTRLKTRYMSKFGLGSTHVMCIVAIERKGPQTAGELAAGEDVDKAQMSRVLSDLTKKEIVVPIDDPTKKYKKQFALTEKGVEVATEIKEILQGIINYVTDGINDDDIETMHKTLMLVSRNIKKASKKVD